jgi:hypothetical protein
MPETEKERSQAGKQGREDHDAGKTAQQPFPLPPGWNDPLKPHSAPHEPEGEFLKEHPGRQ